jgi:hypothetical protein
MGNGMVYLQTSRTSTSTNALDGWIFVWRNANIDYVQVQSNGVNIDPASLVWHYGWQTLNTSSGTNVVHEAIVTPNNQVIYCDGYIMGQFFQLSLLTIFDPTNGSTFVINPLSNTVLPINDTAQALAYVNNTVYIGGALNRIYVWDAAGFAKTPDSYIFLPESNTINIVSVQQNAYVFCGNRGRIYITNGSQADLFAKVPDHLSGSVQPFYQWGSACYNLNKLYFGIRDVELLSASSSNNYGGIWCLDLSTQAMFLQNQLSLGTYAAHVTTFLVMTPKDTFSGYGIYAGWYNEAGSNSGVDVTINSPYTNSASYIISDMIPVGTLLKPMTASQIEYKLSTPLQTGETVQLLMSSNLNDSFTSLGTTTGTGVELSDNFPITVQAQQWLLVKCILTSIASSPSYNRLVQLRIIGDTIKSNVPTQPYSTQ